MINYFTPSASSDLSLQSVSDARVKAVDFVKTPKPKQTIALSNVTKPTPILNRPEISYHPFACPELIQPAPESRSVHFDSILTRKLTHTRSTSSPLRANVRADNATRLVKGPGSGRTGRARAATLDQVFGGALQFVAGRIEDTISATPASPPPTDVSQPSTTRQRHRPAALRLQTSNLAAPGIKRVSRINRRNSSRPFNFPASVMDAAGAVRAGEDCKGYACKPLPPLPEETAIEDLLPTPQAAPQLASPVTLLNPPRSHNPIPLQERGCVDVPTSPMSHIHHAPSHYHGHRRQSHSDTDIILHLHALTRSVSANSAWRYDRGAALMPLRAKENIPVGVELNTKPMARPRLTIQTPESTRFVYAQSDATPSITTTRASMFDSASSITPKRGHPTPAGDLDTSSGPSTCQSLQPCRLGHNSEQDPTSDPRDRFSSYETSTPLKPFESLSIPWTLQSSHYTQVKDCPLVPLNTSETVNVLDNDTLEIIYLEQLRLSTELLRLKDKHAKVVAYRQGILSELSGVLAPSLRPVGDEPQGGERTPAQLLEKLDIACRRADRLARQVYICNDQLGQMEVLKRGHEVGMIQAELLRCRLEDHGRSGSGRESSDDRVERQSESGSTDDCETVVVSAPQPNATPSTSAGTKSNPTARAELIVTPKRNTGLIVDTLSPRPSTLGPKTFSPPRVLSHDVDTDDHSLLATDLQLSYLDGSKNHKTDHDKDPFGTSSYAYDLDRFRLASPTFSRMRTSTTTVSSCAFSPTKMAFPVPPSRH